ncbi:hypothetical protein K501DRAFT_324461 [Backusella circina FSU 941]|nr:hypothetical protein K501DRAFT_324461 [Backusella circina FSU 941]
MLLKTLVILATLLALCQGEFYFPDQRSPFPAIGNMATAQRNNSLVMFGGKNATINNANELFQLTLSNNSFTFQKLPQLNRPDGTSDGRAVIVNDQNTMYLLGGFTNTTIGQDLPLQMYSYDFATSNWSTLQPVTLSTIPQNRALHSSVYDGNRSVYILGGLNASAFFSDFFVMDTITNEITTLPNLPAEIFGHTMSYMRNGQLVVIGGSYRTASMPGFALLSMSTAFIFNTTDRLWYNQSISVLPEQRSPSVRNNHNAVVSSDDKIFIFGGDNDGTPFSKQISNSVNTLDTTTWTWNSPIINGAPPQRRSYASAGFFDSKYLIVAFGQGIGGFYRDINVYDTGANSWLMSFTPAEAESNISGGIIAGITIVCFIVLVCLILLIWKFKRYMQLLFKKAHEDIWKPRTGEPLWAETTRFLSLIFLLFIFALFLAFVIRQAIKSPDVIQTTQQPAATVEVPDIRFCYDGISPPSTPNVSGVTCSTDAGYNCNAFMIPLNMTMFKPVFTDMAGDVNCYLFRAPEYFILTATGGNNNGSKLYFNYYGTPQSPAGCVHIAFYPKKMDPNVRAYGIVDSIPNLMSQEAVGNWITKEINDQDATGVYDIQPYTYSVTNYDMISREHLQPVGWNYVGFLPVTNSTPEIETYFRSEMPNPAYATTHADLGRIQVLPNSFSTIVERDVKIYTLVNALGFVGGIFGILVAIQAWLFGYRPRSPWGVVHRWSTGERKRSLLRGLQSKFQITNSGIPLVHPVHHRYSMSNLGHLDLNEPDDQRINRVEDRMQMLEMLFKAYYVDDEVFRSLDDAGKAESKSWLSKQKNSGNTAFDETREFDSMAPIQDEKMITAEDISSANNDNNNRTLNDKNIMFSRQDTEESTSSHTHLTAHQHRSVSQYKPNTAFQMNDF